MTTPGSHGVRALDSLTSLRFFAATMVLVYHYWRSYLPGTTLPPGLDLGYSGVTFFFVLSGFILAYNYENAGVFPRAETGRYVVARFARIWPTWLLSIAVFAPFFLADVVRYGATPERVAAAVASPLALQAWIPGASTVINYPGWSISTEVFFYLLFPLLVAPAFRRPGATLFAALVFQFVVWVVQALIWRRWGGGDLMIPAANVEAMADFIRYFPVGRLGEFVMGVALCALWREGRAPSDRRILLGAAAVAALGLVLFARHLPQIALHGGGTAVLWVPLILYGAGADRGLLAHPRLVLLGRASFALYLFHAPVDFYARAVDRWILGGALSVHPPVFFALTAAAALAVAVLVHLFVEEPARRAVMRRFDARGAEAHPETPRFATSLGS
jgi:peptidoglycan/LPS O-acetylase OafA/YrhL